METVHKQRYIVDQVDEETDLKECALCYSLDGEAYDTDMPTGIDAGEYTVYLRPAEDPEAEAAAITVEIKKADVIFTAPVSAF